MSQQQKKEFIQLVSLANSWITSLHSMNHKFIYLDQLYHLVTIKKALQEVLTADKSKSPAEMLQSLRQRNRLIHDRESTVIQDFQRMCFSFLQFWKSLRQLKVETLMRQVTQEEINERVLLGSKVKIASQTEIKNLLIRNKVPRFNGFFFLRHKDQHSVSPGTCHVFGRQDNKQILMIVNDDPMGLAVSYMFLSRQKCRVWLLDLINGDFRMKREVMQELIDGLQGIISQQIFSFLQKIIEERYQCFIDLYELPLYRSQNLPFRKRIDRKVKRDCSHLLVFWQTGSGNIILKLPPGCLLSSKMSTKITLIWNLVLREFETMMQKDFFFNSIFIDSNYVGFTNSSELQLDVYDVNLQMQPENFKELQQKVQEYFKEVCPVRGQNQYLPKSDQEIITFKFFNQTLVISDFLLSTQFFFVLFFPDADIKLYLKQSTLRSGQIQSRSVDKILTKERINNCINNLLQLVEITNNKQNFQKILDFFQRNSVKNRANKQRKNMFFRSQKNLSLNKNQKFHGTFVSAVNLANQQSDLHSNFILRLDQAKQFNNWSIDFFAIEDQKLIRFSWAILHLNGSLGYFSVKLKILYRFLYAVMLKCNKHRNSFHNFKHAVSVMHSLFCLLQEGIFDQDFDQVTKFSLLISGLCHDMGHPVQSQHKLSRRYNSRSHLQQYHSACLFKLLLLQDFCIVQKMTFSDFKTFRTCAIGCILATDMSRHFQVLQKFQSSKEEKQGRIIFPKKSQSNQHLRIAQMLIHTCDIGGSSKNFQIAEEWSLRINKQLQNQRKLRGQVGQLGRQELIKQQLNFIENIVSPTFFKLNKYYFSVLTAEALKAIEQNIKRWAQKLKEQIN